MLSATSEYAIRAVVVLAGEYGIRPVRADEVADSIGAPRNYLAKTLNALVKAGIASSARGPHGGFQLARSPEEIALADVIDCFDEPRQEVYLHSHPDDAPCESPSPCVAYQNWNALQMAIREPLTRTSLAQLMTAGPDDVNKINSKESDHAVTD